MLFETRYLSKTFSSSMININKKFIKKDFSLNINKKKYLNYRLSFLTSNKIKNISNTEILKNLISKN